MLALIFVGVMYWLGEALKSTLYSTNVEIARRSNMMAVNAVESSIMSGEKSHPRWDSVARRIVRDDKTRIDIINIRGEVLFSTDLDEQGMTYSLGDAPCSVCHENGSMQASTQTLFIQDPKNDRYQVYAAPLNNADDCRVCHSRDGSKLGMVFVRQALEPIHEQIRTIQLA